MFAALLLYDNWVTELDDQSFCMLLASEFLASCSITSGPAIRGQMGCEQGALDRLRDDSFLVVRRSFGAIYDRGNSHCCFFAFRLM